MSAGTQRRREGAREKGREQTHQRREAIQTHAVSKN